MSNSKRLNAAGPIMLRTLKGLLSSYGHLNLCDMYTRDADECPNCVDVRDALEEAQGFSPPKELPEAAY